MANNTNWLNISSQSGSSGQTILTLSANKNLSMNYKTAEITAYNPVYNISAKTYVTLESYAPILSISPGLFGVPDSGGTYELTISANCAWVIAFPDLVTSFSTSAGSGNAVVTFTVPGTTADTTLVGNIVVTDESGQVSRTARVEQYGSGVHIGIFPVELYFDSTGGSKTFSVTADAAYNVSVGSGTDWAFVEPHSGYTGQTTFTVTVNSENTGTTDKQGVINIDAPGQDLAVILYQRKPETRVVATYYVTSTTDPTKILQNTSSFSKAEYPDGTEITLGTGYTFPTTGYQTVYYTLAGSLVGGFQNSTALKSVVIPKGVTEIADLAFSSCSGLSSVTIPNTVTQLGGSSFSRCTSLSSITLPDSLQTIAGYAFSGCTSLSNITIPSAVTSIGSNCFSGSSVSSITFTSLTPPTLGDTNALTSNTLSEIIVPCPAVNDYITAWPQYAKYISCQDTGTTLYFITDTSNVKGVGEVRTITILNTNINPNRTGLNLPGAFPQQGSYTVDGNVIYLTYPKNPSSSSTRSWTIGVVAQTKDGVSLSGSYKITQNANTLYTIPYTADTSMIDATGETRTITIDASNLVASSITIGVEGTTGATVTYQNGIITIEFPRNKTPNQRNITVTVSGETIAGNEAEATISYVQNTGAIYEIPYTADTSTVDETGETRYIYIDCSQLISSSITVSASGIPGTIVSYDSATCIVTVVFPNSSSSGYELLPDTITIEGETINGNYAYAFVYYEQAGTDISALPLTFVITSDGYIRWGQMNTFTTDSKEISYSKNGGDWIKIRSSVVPLDCPKINVVAGDVLRFKANNTTYGSGSYGDAYFKQSTAGYNVYGNIMSMMYGDDFSGQTGLTGSFKKFFSGEQIRSAKSLILPATYMNGSSYTSMFESCTQLTETPSLPATKVRGADYSAMFAYCTSLKQVPPLPSAMDIGIYNPNRFSYMFRGCTSLTGVPADYLPTLVQGVETGSRLPSSCFEGMFAGCINLKKAPDLPYPVLGGSCYYGMFQGCTSLTTAPELPATTLAGGCYSSMFSDCTGLSAITCLARDISASGCTTNWVKNVAQNGVFTKNHNMSDWTIGDNGIPTNWVVVDKEPYILTGNSLAVTYEVTSTTEPTQILYDNSSTLLAIETAKYDDTPITIQTGYTFPNTGPQTIVFYLTSSTIPNYAFNKCSGITACKIGEGITELGSNCLCGTSLTSVTIGESVTTLGAGCLCGTSLTSVTIPSGVTTIKGVVLTNCQDLTIDSNTYMAAAASSYSGKLAGHFPGVKNIHFGPNVTTIGSYSFSDRSHKIFFINSITFTNNLTRLEAYAFSNFHTVSASLGLTLPDSVTYIGEGCFQNCGLKEVILPSGITSLPARCFYQAYNLKSIVIPDSVTTIGESCFESLESKAGNDNGKVGNITAVTIGSGVTTIGPKAFQFCYNLAHITAKPTVAPTFESNTFNKVNVAYQWYDNNGRPHWAYAETGYLYRPAGSDYSSWIAQLGWQEEDIQ